MSTLETWLKELLTVTLQLKQRIFPSHFCIFKHLQSLPFACVLSLSSVWDSLNPYCDQQTRRLLLLQANFPSSAWTSSSSVTLATSFCKLTFLAPWSRVSPGSRSGSTGTPLPRGCCLVRLIFVGIPQWHMRFLVSTLLTKILDQKGCGL